MIQVGILQEPKVYKIGDVEVHKIEKSEFLPNSGRECDGENESCGGCLKCATVRASVPSGGNFISCSCIVETVSGSWQVGATATAESCHEVLGWCGIKAYEFKSDGEGGATVTYTIGNWKHDMERKVTLTLMYHW